MRKQQEEVTDQLGTETPKFGAKQVIAPGSSPEEALSQIYDYLVNQMAHSRLRVNHKELRFTFLHRSMLAQSSYHELLLDANHLPKDEKVTLLKNYEELFWLTGEVSAFIDTFSLLVDNLPKAFPFITSINNQFNSFKMDGNEKYLLEKAPISDAELFSQYLGMTEKETILKLIAKYKQWKDQHVVESSRELSFDILQDSFRAYSVLEEEAVDRVVVQNAMNNWYKSAFFFKEIGLMLDLMEKAYGQTPSTSKEGNE